MKFPIYGKKECSKPPTRPSFCRETLGGYHGFFIFFDGQFAMILCWKTWLDCRPHRGPPGCGKRPRWDVPWHNFPGHWHVFSSEKNWEPLSEHGLCNGFSMGFRWVRIFEDMLQKHVETMGLAPDMQVSDFKQRILGWNGIPSGGAFLLHFPSFS